MNKYIFNASAIVYYEATITANTEEEAWKIFEAGDVDFTEYGTDKFDIMYVTEVVNE